MLEHNRRTMLAATLGVAALPTALSAKTSSTGKQHASMVPGESQVVLSTDPAVIVETTHGRVRGFRDGEVRIFKGIPYAADTGLTGRFLPPKSPVSWAGVRSSMAYGPTCPQGIRNGWANDEEAFIFHWDDGFTGEDCLRLNVWSRMPSGSAKRPVMVWLHGGGYTAGSSQELPAYDGHRLAERHGVVMVSVNHRLGPLGYIDLSKVGGSEYRHSGNAGMLDLVAALRWVRDNIEAFGGDPSNVTIFGQSGGGSKVSTLMGMPAAKGLFHKAIVQSGSFPLSNNTANATAFAEQVLTELGVGSDLKRLQAVPTAALIEAGQRASRKAVGAGPPNFSRIAGPRMRLPGWSPVVDGDVLPEAPYATRGPGLSKNIPLIVGSTREEFGIGATSLTEAQLLERLGELAPNRREPALAAFKAAYPQMSALQLGKVMAGMQLRDASIEQAELHAAMGGAPAYLYWFTFPSPVLDGSWGSFHCYDLPFCFDNVERWKSATGNTPQAHQVGDAMSSAWTAFARTGNPSTSGNKWPAFSAQKVETMLFDVNPHAEFDPASAARRSLR